MGERDCLNDPGFQAILEQCREARRREKLEPRKHLDAAQREARDYQRDVDEERQWGWSE